MKAHIDRTCHLFYTLRKFKENTMGLPAIMTETGPAQKPNNTAHSLCLFSLKIDRNEFEAIPPDAVDNIAATLKQRGAKIINIETTEVNATFQTTKACTTTAVSIIQDIVQAAKEFDRPVFFVKIGLHIITVPGLEENLVLKHFERPIFACNCADPNEIIITADLYDRLPPQIQNACKKTDRGAGRDRTLYSLSQTPLQTEPSSTSAIIPSAETVSDQLPCFYCGTTAHTSAHCPSKPIQDATDYLNNLGYIPLTRIVKIFKESFPEITRPLKKGTDEERFETLYPERETTPFTIAFFSFYELSEIFQIRSLRRHYVDIFEDPNKQKTGSLRMGQDCLRVARFGEADEWFHKALVENPKDYRPVVGQGLLYMEKEDPREALARFRMALSFSITEDQKAPLYLLCARAYEVSGALEEALEETTKAMRAARGWKEAEYYYAVILAKLERIDEAIDIFRRLSYANPKYLLMVCIDPAINSVRSKISDFIDSEISHLRSRAIESYANIKKHLEKYQKWLRPENRDHQRIYSLYQKASDTLQNESISGIADIPDFEQEITALIRRYILDRKNDLQKKIQRFSKRPPEFSKYLETYPYKFALSANDFEIGRKFQSVYTGASIAVQNATPQGLETAQTHLEELTVLDRHVKTAKDRLETAKTLIFTCEYLFKMLRFFFVSVLLSTLFFFVSFSLFQAVMAPAVLKSLDYLSFFRYGFFAGVIAGIITTGIWIKKSLSKMLVKITKT